MKRTEQRRYNELLKSLLDKNNENKKRDIQTLSKPYYYKGRFNSLKPQGKRAKIREYYQAKSNDIKNDLKDLYNLPEWDTFSACVEWSRNPYWGMNPHAKIIVNNRLVGFGSASGCGYDKLSACICYATNENEQAKRIILGALVRAYCRTDKPLPYGIYKSDKLYLHFDGCGVSTLREIASYCGLKNWEHYETKQSDFISVSRGKE